MSSDHRVLKKNFETEMWVNHRKLPLNHFIQETLANIMVGFLKTLKELDEFITNARVVHSQGVRVPSIVMTRAYPFNQVEA